MVSRVENKLFLNNILFSNRETQIPSVVANNAHPSHRLTTCNNNRAASIELSHTPNRRMQITLPENTTHIVICTSGRGTNNNQNYNVSNNSVTLDINPDGSGVGACCNQTNLSNLNDSLCNNIIREDDTNIMKQNRIQVGTTTDSSDISVGARLLKSVVDCVEKRMVNSSDPRDVTTILSDDGSNEGGKKPHYNCAECGKAYSTSSNLARHRQTHR